ncbi:MAG: 2OG-Fe(II) oxygenase [Polyangiaceae bacterium]|nr:2OG-Fe(II) oxygenase [Polyangiaceae bacterium]
MGRPFFTTLQIPADQAGAADLYGRIFRGEINGVILERFLSAERAAELVRRLENGELAVPKRPFAREFEAYSIGPCLDQTEDHGVPYFDRVTEFNAAVRALFERDIHAALLSLLQSIVENATLCVPKNSDGRSYGTTTLRCLPPGGLIPPHCENEQIGRSPYEHLRSLIEPAIISFYLQLAPAEQGGELAVHNMGFHELHTVEMRNRHSFVGGALNSRERVTLTPQAGDVIVFDAGRYFHQVLPVKGTRSRWTMGGFTAYSHDHSNVFVWA